MKIFVANFSFGGFSDCFVECFPTKKARAAAIREVERAHWFSSAYEFIEVELYDLDIKPTKKDVIRFFNAHAQHGQ